MAAPFAVRLDGQIDACQSRGSTKVANSIRPRMIHLSHLFQEKSKARTDSFYKENLNTISGS